MLHNLQQEGRITYTEDIEESGPAHARAWGCYVTSEPPAKSYWELGQNKPDISFVHLAVVTGVLHNTLRADAVGHVAIGSAGQRQAARDQAAFNALVALGVSVCAMNP